jgi:hypothetical protein
MKKILLGLVAAFAFTTVAPMIARADDAPAADAEKKPAKGKKGKKKAEKADDKKEDAK